MTLAIALAANIYLELGACVAPHGKHDAGLQRFPVALSCSAWIQLTRSEGRIGCDWLSACNCRSSFLESPEAVLAVGEVLAARLRAGRW